MKSHGLLGEPKQSMKGRAAPQQLMLPKLKEAGLLPESSCSLQFGIRIYIYIYIYSYCARYIHVYIYLCMYISAHVSNDIAY